MRAPRDTGAPEVNVLLLLSLTAPAAEIAVDLDRPTVMLHLDKRHQPAELGGRTVTVKNLQPGEHHLEIRTVLGKTLTTLDLTLAPDEKVWIDLRKKSLEIRDRKILALGDAAPADTPRPTEIPSGSVAFSGEVLDGSRMHVLLSGRPLTWSAERTGFVAYELGANEHRYEIFDQQDKLTEGTLPIEAGRHTTCLVEKRISGYVATCSSDTEAWRPSATPPAAE